MRQSDTSESATEGLASLLEIARKQRASLCRGDLEAVRDLQAGRQELLAGIQSLDAGDPAAGETLSEIVRLDREMACLVSSELQEIQDKMERITTLRKLLRSGPHADRRPNRHLSRHI